MPAGSAMPIRMRSPPPTIRPQKGPAGCGTTLPLRSSSSFRRARSIASVAYPGSCTAGFYAFLTSRRESRTPVA